MLENYPYLLDFKQVQEILRIGRNQLLFRLQSGEIPAFKVGRKWRMDCKMCLQVTTVSAKMELQEKSAEA